MMLVEFIAVMMVVAFQMLVRLLAEAVGQGDPRLKPIAEPRALHSGRGELI
jgi:hypothetical protein